MLVGSHAEGFNLARSAESWLSAPACTNTRCNPERANGRGQAGLFTSMPRLLPAVNVQLEPEFICQKQASRWIKVQVVHGFAPLQCSPITHPTHITKLPGHRQLTEIYLAELNVVHEGEHIL